MYKQLKLKFSIKNELNVINEVKKNFLIKRFENNMNKK